MSPDELDECFEFVSNLVKECGEVLKEGFKNCGEITIKTAEHDIVTIYDKKIEDILMKRIAEKYPEHW
jgi:fructose-1,6-bisphosphatase/inositol monophosphatase family enzyme